MNGKTGSLAAGYIPETKGLKPPWANQGYDKYEALQIKQAHRHFIITSSTVYQGSQLLIRDFLLF